MTTHAPRRLDQPTIDRPGRRPRSAVLATVGLVGGLCVWPAHAGAPTSRPLPPWSTDASIPAWAESVHVLRADEPLRATPQADAARRGSASREARLPLFAARRGAGCREPWLHVGVDGWICGDHVQLSGEPPLPIGPGEIGTPGLGRPIGAAAAACGRARPGQPGPRAESDRWRAWLPCPLFGVARAADGLPFRYFFVGRDGSLGYERIEQVDVDEPAMSFEQGFGVAIVEERTIGGEIYGRSNRGLWLPMRDLGPARPLAFEGLAIEHSTAGPMPVAWVVVDRAALYARQGRLFVPNGRSRGRFERLAVLEAAETFANRYLRIDEQSWIDARSVRQPSVTAPPAEVDIGRAERWIDIELASQTLVAYEGATAVFATLVSTGRGKGPKSATATPLGVHRIWVKLLSSDMDNLEDEWATHYYRIEDVPYVQYFSKGVGLHAVFWHRSLGHVRSHGCVNLAPLDAERLFWWTGPALPNGWTAVLPASRDPGTLVQVR